MIKRRTDMNNNNIVNASPSFHKGQGQDTENKPQKEGLFSYFKPPIRNTSPLRDITVKEAFNAIKGDILKPVIERLRGQADDGARSQIKGNELSYFTFSGTFSQRKKDALINYSGLICIDFDDLTSVDEAKQKILNQTSVDTVLLFTSPSGNGLKWVIPSDTAENHERNFEMYLRFASKELGLNADQSGKDIARACFVSYDPGIYLNSEYEYKRLNEYWDKQEEKTCLEPQREAPRTPAPKPLKRDKKPKNQIHSPFDDYNKQGDVLGLLKRHGWKEFSNDTGNIRLTRPGKKTDISGDLRKSDNLFHVFTDGTEFTASESYNPSQVFAVLECSNDMKQARARLISLGYGDFTPSFSDTDETLEFDKTDTDLNFYSNDYKISPSRLAEFYEREGFIRINEPGNDSIIIVKNKNKILKKHNHKTETTSYLSSCIKPEHEGKRQEIEATLIANDHKIINSFKLLKSKPYEFNRDTKDSVYIPFKNGVAKISKYKEGDEVKTRLERIDYTSDEIKFFSEGIESLDHNFDFDLHSGNHKMGDFENFVIRAIINREVKEGDKFTKEEKQKISAIYSTIGYLISDYKDEAESPAIVFTDEGADGKNLKGGRGKTLITDALTKVLKHKKRGGKEVDLSYRHTFAHLEKSDSLYIIDDAPAGFKYHDLFTQITGDVAVEQKGKDVWSINKKDAPKIVITTNYVFRYNKEEVSINRRFVELKFSNYWDFENTPVSVYKRNFFSEWDTEQWQLFYEFLIKCVIEFLSKGLQRIEYDKKADNYNAYFSDDALLTEFERCFKEMLNKGSFTVQDFLNEHENYSIRERIFHRNNARKFIEPYIEYHNLGISYEQKTRSWKIKTDLSIDDDSSENIDDLPF